MYRETFISELNLFLSGEHPPENILMDKYNKVTKKIWRFILVIVGGLGAIKIQK
jgi:hypothetical protein